MRSAEQLASFVLDKAESILPVNIVAIINRMGIDVYFCPFSDDVNGFYTKIDGRPTIAINSQHGVKRQRFTAAHELYHHIAEGKDLQLAASIMSMAREKKADRFAAAVLMPSSSFKDLFNRGMSFMGLASAFKVSQQAAEIRAIELGLTARMIA